MIGGDEVIEGIDALNAVETRNHYLNNVAGVSLDIETAVSSEGTVGMGRNGHRAVLGMCGIERRDRRR